MRLSKEYLEVQGKYDENDILEKTVEEIEELLYAAKSMVKNSSNSGVRENFMEEFMDVSRMVTVWIERFAAESEKERMHMQDKEKIEKFIEKNKKTKTGSWK